MDMHAAHHHHRRSDLADTTATSMSADGVERVSTPPHGPCLAFAASPTPGQHGDLLAADARVVHALLCAKMSVSEVAAWAGTVSREDVAQDHFMEILAGKIKAGLNARDALLWARFGKLASAHELSCPTFLRDLSEAGLHGHGRSLSRGLLFARACRSLRALDDAPTRGSNLWAAVAALTCHSERMDPLFLHDLALAANQDQGAPLIDVVHCARAAGLRRHLGQAVAPSALLSLDTDSLRQLRMQDAASLRTWLARGLSLTHFLQATPFQRASLGDACAEVVSTLLTAGMPWVDVARLAGHIQVSQTRLLGFVTALHDALSTGISSSLALKWASLASRNLEALWAPWTLPGSTSMRTLAPAQLGAAPAPQPAP